MIRAWLVPDALARRWAEGWAEDVDLVAARPLPGEPAAVYVVHLAGRREAWRLYRLALTRGWGIAGHDPAGHWAEWRCDLVNGPAKYVSAETLGRQQRRLQGAS